MHKQSQYATASTQTKSVRKERGSRCWANGVKQPRRPPSVLHRQVDGIKKAQHHVAPYTSHMHGKARSICCAHFHAKGVGGSHRGCVSPRQQAAPITSVQKLISTAYGKASFCFCLGLNQQKQQQQTIITTTMTPVTTTTITRTITKKAMTTKTTTTTTTTTTSPQDRKC